MPGESPRLRLNPENTALLVIDVQMALFSRPTPIHKADDLIRNINSLVEMFQLSNALVIYIQHSNNKMLIKDSDGWQFHPDLNFKEDDQHIVVFNTLSFNRDDLVNIPNFLLREPFEIIDAETGQKVPYQIKPGLTI